MRARALFGPAAGVLLVVVDAALFWALRLPLVAAPAFAGAVVSAFFFGRGVGIRSMFGSLRAARSIADAAGHELFFKAWASRAAYDQAVELGRAARANKEAN